MFSLYFLLYDISFYLVLLSICLSFFIYFFISIFAFSVFFPSFLQFLFICLFYEFVQCMYLFFHGLFLFNFFFLFSLFLFSFFLFFFVIVFFSFCHSFSLEYFCSFMIREWLCMPDAQITHHSYRKTLVNDQFYHTNWFVPGKAVETYFRDRLNIWFCVPVFHLKCSNQLNVLASVQLVMGMWTCSSFWWSRAAHVL